MLLIRKIKQAGLFGLMLAPVLLAGCKTTGEETGVLLGEKSYSYPVRSYSLSERSCLERVMFFEANRSSREGLIAVGTVVMNRVNSSQYPDTICGVVGQYKQFAPGVLTRPINMAILPDVREAADAVLRGERHKKLKNAMFFHTAGLTFPYSNMHYRLVAGGNAFYEKRRRDGSLSAPVDDQPYDVAFAYAQERAGQTVLSDMAAGQMIPDMAMAEKGVVRTVVPEKAGRTSEPMETVVSAMPQIVPVPHFRDVSVVLGYADVPAVQNGRLDVIGDLLRQQQTLKALR